MTPAKRVKDRNRRLQLVGVIASPADLRRAIEMPDPPDLFELRLDQFEKIDRSFDHKIARLGAGLIFTARAPGEGGANNLSPNKRIALLRQFLPRARYIDVELRSAARFQNVIAEAGRRKIDCILSFHDFVSTPGVRSLCTKAERALEFGADVFKVATRTDSDEQVRRLLDFVAAVGDRVPLTVMGMGKYALSSRVALAAAGSMFAYAAISRPRVAGQPTLAELRSALARAGKRLL